MQAIPTSRQRRSTDPTPGQSVLAPPRIERRLAPKGRDHASTFFPSEWAKVALVSAVAVIACTTLARAEKISGASLAVRSNGEPTGDAWTLRGNGYVGTYVRLEKPGDVRVRVTADARWTIVVGGERSDAADAVFTLPAGTHFVRVQRAGSPFDATTTLASIDVDGGAVLNAHTDANALAAADTYIDHGRRREVTVTLPDVAPGTVVHVRQRRLGFDVGGNASGARNVLLAPDPPADSDPARFQAFVTRHFNALVPSNAGKWSNNEEERRRLTMEYVDAVIAFAAKHGMHVRMHNLIWDSPQQPKWAIDLLDAAAAGDARAKAELRQAISERIGYYLRERGGGFQEVDILNESEHKPKYVRAFGLDGVAEIYKESADALRAAGSDARTFVNEYNVLQYSQRLTDGKAGASDPFANWYREHVDALNARGGRVGGFGVQYYADPRPDVREPHSAARIFGVFQNLSVTGLPVSLTEFGIKTGGDETTNARIMDETLRLTFGTPGATGFLFFGFWERAMWEQAPAAMLVDKDWRLTPLGEAFTRRMATWHTELDATVDAQHTIRFAGFLGDYELTTDTVTKTLSLVRGTTNYEIR